MSEFDFLFNDDKNKSVTKSKSSAIKIKAMQFKLLRLKNLDSIVTLPKKDEMFVIKTKGAFDAITFLDLLVDKNNYLDEVYLASYGLSKNTINTFRYYLENKQIGTLSLLGSKSFRARFPNEYIKLLKLSNDFNFNVFLTDSHAKIYLFKIHNNFYVVEGSGNLTMNAKFEQYTFTNSRQMFNFFREDFE